MRLDTWEGLRTAAELLGTTLDDIITYEPWLEGVRCANASVRRGAA